MRIRRLPERYSVEYIINLSTIVGCAIGIAYVICFCKLIKLSKAGFSSNQATSHYPITAAFRLFLLRCIFFIGCCALLWYYREVLDIQAFCTALFFAYVLGLLYVFSRRDA